MVPRIRIFIILLLILVLLAGCESEKPSEFPQHLMINYSARNLGTLFPCGCHTPIGGLSRRGGVITQESPYPQLTLDAGNFVAGNTGYDRFTGDYILEACKLMGYHAVNLGENESVQTIEQLESWDALTGGLLVSANLMGVDGLPVSRAYIVEEVGGIKIGITGVAPQRDIPPDAIGLPERVDPIDPLLSVMENFETQKVDFVVLLTDMSSSEISTILASVPGIDLVIQGTEFVPSRQPEIYMPTESTRLVNMGGSGKYLGRLRLDFDSDGTVKAEEVMKVELDSYVPTMSEISIILTDFRAELRDRRSEFLGDPANPFQRSQSPEFVDVLTGYTGEGFCLRCHVGYNYEGRTTGHADAWDNLDDASKADPECLQCHTTGYGVATGLEDPFRDTHLTAVTCEACHGPAARHVREMTAIKEGLDVAAMLDYVDETGLEFSRTVPEDVCRGCHTEEWSPDFDYGTWVGIVKHSAAEFDPGETILPPPIPMDE